MQSSRILASPQSGGDRPSSSTGDHHEGNGETDPSTILIVEDEILVRMAVADYLRGCGYRVLEASTGEEAQAIFRDGQRIEILFTDIELGSDINGFALAQWVRATYPDVRIILTSGVARMAQTAGTLCDQPFFTKPYAHEKLAEEIKRLLGALGRRSRLTR